MFFERAVRPHVVFIAPVQRGNQQPESAIFFIGGIFRAARTLAFVLPEDLKRPKRCLLLNLRRFARGIGYIPFDQR